MSAPKPSDPAHIADTVARAEYDEACDYVNWYMAKVEALHQEVERLTRERDMAREEIAWLRERQIDGPAAGGSMDE